jgi:hypothetical protein
LTILLITSNSGTAILQLRSLWRATRIIVANRRRHAWLLMLFTQQVALVERLRTRRNVQRGVFIEEVDWLQVDRQDLIRHDREVLNAMNVIDIRLDIHHKVGISDVLVSLAP